MFGRGRLTLAYADDRDGLHRMAGRLAAAGAAAVVVVDADRHPEPKDLLADIADAGFPLAVLSDGTSGDIADHALSVGAAACLTTARPARDLVSLLAALCRPAEEPTGRY